jgi:hypothetical protein
LVNVGRPRGKMSDPDAYLSVPQRVLFKEVSRLADAYRSARLFRERELREQLNAELRVLREDMEAAVRRAYEPTPAGSKPAKGLSKATLRRAIGVSDPATLNRYLEGYDPEMYAVPEPTPEFEFMEVKDKDGFGWLVQVNWSSENGEQFDFDDPKPVVDVYISAYTFGEFLPVFVKPTDAHRFESKKVADDLLARVAKEATKRYAAEKNGSGVAGR